MFAQGGSTKFGACESILFTESSCVIEINHTLFSIYSYQGALAGFEPRTLELLGAGSNISTTLLLWGIISQFFWISDTCDQNGETVL